MEILDEFDNESPLYVSFCKRISPEAFERQSLTYTQTSLEELYTQMELNPGACERLVRKRKQLENEEGGLASYLKVHLGAFLIGRTEEPAQVKHSIAKFIPRRLL